MKTLTLLTASSVLALALTACGGAAPVPLASLDAVDRARAAVPAQEAEKVAPQVVALADVDRRKADEALAAGDEVAADLYATRALVTLEQAIVLGRLARAAAAERDARARAEHSASEARELAATRSKLDADNAELDKKVKVARELAQPPVSGPADPKREAARKTAAESLNAEAHLLCGAARLLSTDKAINAELDAAEAPMAIKTGATSAQLIDHAARSRASCLSILTRLRRASPDAARGVHADALLSELSATGHFDVSRDERGVVVTLRDVFDGSKLKTGAEERIAELGRVLKSNAGYRAQVVVHEAAKRDDGSARAKSVATPLVQAAGVPEAQVAAEDAGTKLPVLDPSDAKLRARNARVEVVFVSPVN